MSKRYSLWLVPDRNTEEYRDLKDMIERYSERYSSPVFEPHLTLIGGVEAEREGAKEKTRQLAENSKPLNLDPVRPHFSTTKTQCFFLLARPTARLFKTRQRADDIFGAESGMYLPHFSLLYGDLPLEERQELSKSFDRSILPLDFQARTVELIEITGSSSDYKSVSEFVDTWQNVDSYRLD